MGVIICLPFGRSFAGVLADAKAYVTAQGDEVSKVFAILSPGDREDELPVGVQIGVYRPKDGDDVLYVVNGGTTASQWEIARMWAAFSAASRERHHDGGTSEPVVRRLRIVNLQRDAVTLLHLVRG